MKGIKGIIFDFNGVLVDDYLIQKESWSNISLEVRKREVTDKEMLKNIRGKKAEDIITWLGNDKLNKIEVEKLSQKKRLLTQELCSHSPLYTLAHGLEDLLNQIKNKNIPLTICTSSSFQGMQFNFSKLKLERWFDIDKIEYNDGSYPGKPAPDAYLRAVKRLNLNPEDCLVFEDALSGVKSAYKAGIKNIIVIGTNDRLVFLTKQSGIIKGIHNFSEFTLNDLLII